MARGIFNGNPSRALLSERSRLMLAYRPSAREVFEILNAERLAALAAGTEADR